MKATKVGKFRTILPQILACVAKNLILMDIGMSIVFPSIVIPILQGTDPERRERDGLTFTDVQASWFGSLAFIFQPIGCILSGWITERVGRKRAMIFVNFPHIIAWLLLHFATSVEEMYAAAIILGLGVGFMETPVISYIGEICQPSIRGILTATTGVAATLGYSIVYLLGSVTNWRNAALVCFATPILTILAILFLPDSPIWLISRQREEEALRSLQWLRGWVPRQNVQEEFQQLRKFHSTKKDEKQEYRLFKKSTLKPFFIVTMFFVFTQMSGLAGMRPYLVQIFHTYQVPVDPNWATVIVGLLKLSGNICCMISIRFLGKRRIILISTAGVAISCLSIGFYAFLNLPHGISSFDQNSRVENPQGIYPLIGFFILSFLTSFGIAPLPWVLLSEILPFRSRGLTSGLSAAINYILVFVAAKTYLNLERGLSLHGVIWLYASVGAIAFIFHFFLMPETEDRSLEEIEQHFTTQKITNIHIQKITKYSTCTQKDESLPLA
ncbi:facilitated trehalose transporter Tret1-like [Lutzomyia longipalpis]|uniref:facilitated trehalose transporter Tret1-like n=1 Tax=Lutzomyia longipalpis TaxID=7200 RepID=UPI0024842686|nr:facilitated trehalose transporter Tret1-like [Lutzomyia longipalpis]